MCLGKLRNDQFQKLAGHVEATTTFIDLDIDYDMKTNKYRNQKYPRSASMWRRNQFANISMTKKATERRNMERRMWNKNKRTPNKS